MSAFLLAFQTVVWNADTLALVQSRDYSAQFKHFKGLRNKMCKAVPLGWQLWLYFEVALYCYFPQYWWSAVYLSSSELCLSARLYIQLYVLLTSQWHSKLKMTKITLIFSTSPLSCPAQIIFQFSIISSLKWQCHHLPRENMRFIQILFSWPQLPLPISLLQIFTS